MKFNIKKTHDKPELTVLTIVQLKSCQSWFTRLSRIL